MIVNPVMDFRKDKFLEEVQHDIPSTFVLEHSADPRRFFSKSFWANLAKICPVTPTKIHLTEFDDAPLHVDIAPNNVIYTHLILSGSMDFLCGDECRSYHPGDWLKVIPNKPHSVIAHSRVITLCLESYAYVA